jgi:hypothetical protein
MGITHLGSKAASGDIRLIGDRRSIRLKGAQKSKEAVFARLSPRWKKYFSRKIFSTSTKRKNLCGK